MRRILVVPTCHRQCRCNNGKVLTGESCDFQVKTLDLVDGGEGTEEEQRELHGENHGLFEKRRMCSRVRIDPFQGKRF